MEASDAEKHTPVAPVAPAAAPEPEPAPAPVAPAAAEPDAAPKKPVKKTKKNASVMLTVKQGLIERVQDFLQTNQKMALKTFQIHVARLVEEYGTGQRCHFWSPVDTAALESILENKLFTKAQGDAAIEDYAAFMKWFDTTPYTFGEQIVFKHFVQFLIFVFMKHTVKIFNFKLREMLKYYDERQFDLVDTLLDACIAQKEAPVASSDADGFHKAVSTILRFAEACAHKEIQPRLVGRLQYCRKSVQALKKEFHPTETIAVPDAAAKKKKKKRSKKQQQQQQQQPAAVVETAADEKKPLEESKKAEETDSTPDGAPTTEEACEAQPPTEQQ
jgi:hypothetical protein